MPPEALQGNGLAISDVPLGAADRRGVGLPARYRRIRRLFEVHPGNFSPVSHFAANDREVAANHPHAGCMLAEGHAGRRGTAHREGGKQVVTIDHADRPVRVRTQYVVLHRHRWSHIRVLLAKGHARRFLQRHLVEAETVEDMDLQLSGTGGAVQVQPPVAGALIRSLRGQAPVVAGGYLVGGIDPVGPAPHHQLLAQCRGAQGFAAFHIQLVDPGILPPAIQPLRGRQGPDLAAEAQALAGLPVQFELGAIGGNRVAVIQHSVR